MNEPLRTPELKFFRRADLVRRDVPVEESQFGSAIDPILHVRRLEVG
jgi:hypothetical protein